MSNKKPRLEGAPELIATILQQPKDPFAMKLAELQGDDLTALDDKLLEIRSWVMERKLQLHRASRVRAKEEVIQQRRAIYHSRQQPCNSNSYFSAESATALLDSGFLGANDIGKLCLLTGKLFVGDLKLNHNYIWKNIFEAEFNYEAERGLSLLYQNPKLDKLLNEKGYERLFRNFFVKSPPVPEEVMEFPVGVNDKPSPAPALNSQNFLFLALLRSRDEYGFLKPCHVEILDNQTKLEEFMSGETNEYEVPTSCKNETTERIKLAISGARDHHPVKKKSKFREWRSALKKRITKCPQNFHSTVLKKLFKCSGKALVSFMFNLQVSVIAFRMDTMECTNLCEITEFFEDAWTVSSEGGGRVCLNKIGESQIKGLFEGYENVKPNSAGWLGLASSIGFEGSHAETGFSIRALATEEEGEAEDYFDMYRILDYGINWGGF